MVGIMSDDAPTFEGFLPYQSLFYLTCFVKMCLHTSFSSDYWWLSFSHHTCFRSITEITDNWRLLEVIGRVDRCSPVKTKFGEQCCLPRFTELHHPGIGILIHQMVVTIGQCPLLRYTRPHPLIYKTQIWGTCSSTYPQHQKQGPSTITGLD